MKKNWLLVPAAALAVVTVTVLIPSALVALWPSHGKTPSAPIVELQTAENDIPVKVYVAQEQKVVTMPMEKYVRGVVAAEMPVTFEKEALAAQAIAARTYIVRRLQAGTKTEQGADVTDDHNEGQQYATDEMLQKRWGLAAYGSNLSKINAAVNETKGQVALYNGKPIEALFFSTSSGATENAEDYFGGNLPYLKSVPSPWDKQSEKYESTLSMPISQFEQKLGLAALPAANIGSLIQPLERSVTEHIKKLRVGDKTFTGPEFRTLLGLRSTMFTWQVDSGKGTISFDMLGYGHGVGLSQYGANGMAKDGKTAADIIKYYYQGVTIGNLHDVLPNR